MKFQFHILGSSSEGNCALLVTPGARVLIDAGFTCKRIRERLAAVGGDIESIDAVFVTHEHSDHSKGIAGLARLGRPVFFANAETARAVETVCNRGVATPVRPRWRVFTTGGGPFGFNDITITPFSIPHDAADPVGYVFSFADAGGAPVAVAWTTDLGYVPQLVLERVAAADVLVLESNYDPAMLDASRRPPSLKQRIRGRHGHLSNDAAAALLMSLPAGRLRRVFLAHLSRECNDPRLVHEAFALARPMHPRCVFTIVDPDAPAPVSL